MLQHQEQAKHKCRIKKLNPWRWYFLNLVVLCFNVYNKIRGEAKNLTLKFYQMRENYFKTRDIRSQCGV